MTTSQPIEQRSKQALAELFVRMLKVPSVFFDAPWPNSKHLVDVLAIDRAGVGDVHVVEIKRTLDQALSDASLVLNVPGQFRWLAFYNPDGFDQLGKSFKKANKSPLFAAEGMGRIGIIEVAEVDNSPEPGMRFKAAVVIRAERFPGSYYDEADKFTASHKPDIMFH